MQNRSFRQDTRPALARRSAGRATLLLAIAAFLCVAVAAPEAQAEVLPGHQLTLQQNSQALGISGGYPGASGFVYRKYFGNSFLQINLLPLVANRGGFLAVMMGATYGQYLLVWQRQNSMSLMPTTTALRAVAGTSTYFSRDDGETDTSSPSDVIGSPPKTTATTTTTTSKIKNTTGLSAGIGFEFGAIMRSGFSFSVDLMLTATWDNDGFEQLVPLPFGAVVYSW
jgi:hypothetical protein